MRDEGLAARETFRILAALVVILIAIVAIGQALMIEPETAMHQIYQVRWFAVASIWWLGVLIAILRESPMTLHDAIADVLRAAGRELASHEIASAIAARDFHRRRDRQRPTAWHVRARMTSDPYRQLFSQNPETRA